VTLGVEFIKITWHVTPAAKNRSLKSRDAFSPFEFFIFWENLPGMQRRIVQFWRESGNLAAHATDNKGENTSAFF